MYQQGQKLLLLLANTLTILNKFEDAKQLYKDIIKINPNIELSYLKIADILRDQKYYQEAKDYYFQCISINQNNSDAYFGIGECLKETQQFYEAQQYYVTAIEINQSNLQYKFCYDKYIYSYQLGNCLRTLGKYHEAICVYDQCQMIDTNHDETIAAIGYK